jgi:DNA polymerase III gamma/tau subunit
VTDDEVIRVLGTPPDERTIAIVKAIVESSAAIALGELAAVLDAGVTLSSVMTALGDIYRNMMLVTTCGSDSELIELPEAQREEVAKLAEGFTLPALVQGVGILQRTAQNIRGSSVGRALVEAALVRLAEADKFVDPASLVERLEQLSGMSVPITEQKKKPVASSSPIAADSDETPPRHAGKGMTSTPQSTRAESTPEAATESPEEPTPRRRAKPLSTSEREQIQKDPAVREVMTLFDGDLIHMERVETPDPAVVSTDRMDPDCEDEEDDLDG